MKKGERIEISVSVTATDDLDDEQADVVAFDALVKARDALLSSGCFKRLRSEMVVVGPVIVKRHRRRDRDVGIPGEVCTCHLDTGKFCPRHPWIRRGRTETPEGGSGNVQ